jgi:asparagine synthase (glutamine-hydrolysing)
MSGISGVVRLDGAPQAALGLGRALRALENWGAAPCTWESAAGDVALGCRLFAVTPEDAFEQQPVRAADDSVVLVADARLDNRAELGRELGVPVAVLRTLSDSALILRAWEAWGEDCPRRLLGDFAFILWDAGRRTLFCARDHLGQRVLFWGVSGRGLTVASAARAVVAAGAVSAQLNEQKVADFLVLLEDAGSTYFAGVQRLPPAHVLVADASGVRLRRYWAVDATRRIELGSDAAYVEAFLEIFERAVRARLRCATPVGVMLSGGLDSASVAAVAARSLATRGQRLHAFHAAPRTGFGGAVRPGWVSDESADVRAIAAMHDNLELRIHRPDGRTPLDHLDELFAALGAPVRNPGNLAWVQAIYEAAAHRGVRVLLTGQKGNATISFTGLRALREQFREGRVRFVLRQVRALARARNQRVRDVFRDQVLRPLTPLPVLRLLRRVRGVKTDRTDVSGSSAIRPEFARAMHVVERAREQRADETRIERAGAAEYRVLALTAGGDAPDVTHSLRARFGVETRDPTSDIRVVDYCLGIPGDQYLRHGHDRWLVRRSLRALLPPQVLERTTRGAQASDWTEWFTGMRPEMSLEVERLEQSETARRCLDLPRMRDLLARWPERLGVEHIMDYNLILLRGIVMGRFIRWFEASRS